MRTTILTEPEVGSDLASAKLAARRDGDDHVLSGQKIFVGSAFEAILGAITS